MTEPDSALGPLDPATVLAQLGSDPRGTGELAPRVVPSTTFARDENLALLSPGIDYARDASPSVLPAERALATLEGGEDALLFSSGMAAAAAVLQTLAPGARVVFPEKMYWALRGYARRFCEKWGLSLAFVDATDLGRVRAVVTEAPTQLVWLETPANPTWEVSDIEAIATIAKEAGARLVVDSTAATPLLTRPLSLGADLVMHSATKYLNGHSDVVAGALVTRHCDDAWARLRAHRRETGAILGPFEAWLLARGMRTLPLRVERACRTALGLARRFERHPAVLEVLYPGLPSAAGHEVARRQMVGGFGGMLSLRLRGGASTAIAVAGRLKLFTRATSLGGTESLVEHRASVEGPDSPVPADLLRLSIGLEHEDDLARDLDQALAPWITEREAMR
jgi:cystathionine gamma-synthase